MRNDDIADTPTLDGAVDRSDAQPNWAEPVQLSPRHDEITPISGQAEYEGAIASLVDAASDGDDADEGPPLPTKVSDRDTDNGPSLPLKESRVGNSSNVRVDSVVQAEVPVGGSNSNIDAEPALPAKAAQGDVRGPLMLETNPPTDDENEISFLEL